MYRGPIDEGKDRQHPVNPPYPEAEVMTPALWVTHRLPTWYQLSGVPLVPPATVIPEEPDNG
jgi:hypothetical protein